MPRVVLESDLLLHFAIVDLNGSKGLHSVRSVNGLPRFPSQKKKKKCDKTRFTGTMNVHMYNYGMFLWIQPGRNRTLYEHMIDFTNSLIN